MSTTTKFTPKPWEACERGDYADDGIVILGDERRLAVVSQDEDAALIAAAPALYDALMAVLEGVNGARSDEDLDCSTEVGGYLLGDVMNDALDAANAALAAARGEG